MKKSVVIIFITIFILSGGCRWGFCQQDNTRFLRWTINDPVDLFSDVTPRKLLKVGTVGAGVMAIAVSDGPISQNIQNHYKNSSTLHFANRWGEWRLAASVSTGIFGTSLLTRNKKFQDAAFTTLQSLLMTKVVVGAGKFLMARKRPYHQDGPFDMQLAELGYTSFPSGHTATAFALVTPWVIYYPNVFTYSMMAIPVGTAIARVAKGQHWLSDVTAGAAIGFSMSYYLAKKHLSIQSDKVQIMPAAGPKSLSLRVNLSF